MRESTNIRCEEVVDQLLTYLDGEIEGGQRNPIEQHLEECRGCCSRADFELALRNKVREAGTKRSPAALRKKIRQLIDDF